MSVAQRRPTIALVRSIGAKRSVVATDVVIEAALSGVVAGLIGIPLGLVLGYWAIDRTPPFLLQIVSAPLIFVVPWIAIPITLVACVFATVLASIVAARQVYRVEPLEALLSARLQPAEQIARRTTLVAGVLGAAAIVAASAIAKFVSGLVVVGAAALFILGVLLLGVAFAKVMVAGAVWLSKRLGPSGQLASASITRSPRRAWATAMTVGIAVAVGCAVFGALNDLVDSASDSLSRVRNTDLLLAGTPPASVPDVAFPAEWEGRVRATPGVESVVPGQFAHVTVGDVQTQVAGLAPGNNINVAPLLEPDALHRVLAGEGVAISQPLADRFGYSVGDDISVGTPTGIHTTKVVAQFRFVSTDAGLIAMSLGDMRQWFDRPGATYLAITLESGANVADVQSRLRAEFGDQAYVFTGQQAFEATTRNITQAGSLAVGLQWIVAVIAAIALMNTLTLAVLQRRREFGVLRAIGATRRRIARMVLAEALAVGVVGGVIGIVGGELVHYISDIVLTTTTGIDISFGANPLMLLSAAIALVLCLLGAIPPALRAARLNILQAVTVE
nr:FtsX family ABC transporter permease [Antrihabitans stalactiti]